MDSNLTRHQLLDTAKASPAAIAQYDRQAWINLFSTDYIIEDPVGSRPHQPQNQERLPLEKFYDTFIAPNNISFNVDRDIVAGNVVVRDVVIEITMSTKVKLRVPMHLFYEITSENDELKIKSLRAHWELIPMIRQLLGNGVRGIAASLKLGLRMMRIQGISGMIGFSKGSCGIHKKGKETVNRFVEAANLHDHVKLSSMFDDPDESISLVASGQRISPQVFCDIIGSHFTVTKLISAGYFVSFSYTWSNWIGLNGVGIFEFNPKSKKIKHVRLYHDSDESR